MSVFLVQPGCWLLTCVHRFEFCCSIRAPLHACAANQFNSTWVCSDRCTCDVNGLLWSRARAHFVYKLGQVCFRTVILKLFSQPEARHVVKPLKGVTCFYPLALLSVAPLRDRLSLPQRWTLLQRFWRSSCWWVNLLMPLVAPKMKRHRFCLPPDGSLR